MSEAEPRRYWSVEEIDGVLVLQAHATKALRDWFVDRTDGAEAIASSSPLFRSLKRRAP